MWIRWKRGRPSHGPQGKNAKALEFGVDVDGVSQATKTSKGIVNAVNQAIAYFDQVTAVQKDDTAWQTKGEEAGHEPVCQ